MFCNKQSSMTLQQYIFVFFPNHTLQYIQMKNQHKLYIYGKCKRNYTP